MKFESKNFQRRNEAFSLIEVLVCTALVSIAFVSLYTGIASSYGVVSISRENLRGNQILLEKMETIRLYSWDQINSNGFIPPTFTAEFFPRTITNLIGTNVDGSPKYSTFSDTGGGGVSYYGTVTVTNAEVSSQYATNMRLVIVTLTWTNKGIERVRELQTLISANGLQNYIFN